MASNDIPQHSRLLIERLLENYCRRICPPTARNVVALGYRIEANQVILEEYRRICGVPGTRRAVPLARFRYRSGTASWLLDDACEDQGWRRHKGLNCSRSFLELLREFDADPEGVYWHRLDGKSLRWCSSKGRCAPCELRYGEVLGLAVTLHDQKV